MASNLGLLSRYKYGVVTINHKGKDVTTSVGTPMDDFIEDINGEFTFTKGTIPAPHDKRPDLTSNTFYSTPKFWWLIMQYNNISDPFEGLSKGTDIRIPEMS